MNIRHRFFVPCYALLTSVENCRGEVTTGVLPEAVSSCLWRELKAQRSPPPFALKWLFGGTALVGLPE